MSKLTDHDSALSRNVRDFVRRGFAPRYGQPVPGVVKTDAAWQRLRELGTELWLDSGDAGAIGRLWSREFAAVTTNNTLLNKEVQKGAYDGFIREAAGLLADYPGLSDAERRLELAFMLNARHGLKLVELFDAFVSVEEHTALANDLAGSVNYARRFHAICPERFYVKIPLSAAGILATRQVEAEGISVNHTLGFSARQNYLIARLARPAFVNVFLGRLNSVTADNGLGDGAYVGERAALASQLAIRLLREEHGLPTRQIAASLRSGPQVSALAGVDVMTVPITVAAEFLDARFAPDHIRDRTQERYAPQINADAAWARFDTLWDVPDKLKRCVDRLAGEPLDTFSAEGLSGYLDAAGCGDLLVRWTAEQVETSAREGKIPRLANWRGLLATRRIGLDSLMNLAGLNSFRKDQDEMDRHVAGILARRAG